MRGGQHHRALRSMDFAFVFGGRRNKGDVAAFGNLDLALIDDSAAARPTGEFVLAGHKLRIGNRQGRGRQRADIHLATATKDDASGVDNHHLTVGVEITEDVRWVLIRHAVERNAGGVGLLKRHAGFGADIEALPIGDHLRRGLGHGHGAAVVRNAARATDDLATAWQLGRRRLGKSRR